MKRRDADRREESLGSPLPSAPNVGFRVPAKPLSFEHWGAHKDSPLPNHALSVTAISKTRKKVDGVGSQVPAKPSRFEHWGAHEYLPLPNHALNLATISKASSANSQHRGHKIYTGSGHRRGVIPYSSVCWWIASWAEDEQYKRKNSLLRRGVLVLGALV